MFLGFHRQTSGTHVGTTLASGLKNAKDGSRTMSQKFVLVPSSRFIWRLGESTFTTLGLLQEWPIKWKWQWLILFLLIKTSYCLTGHVKWVMSEHWIWYFFFVDYIEFYDFCNDIWTTLTWKCLFLLFKKHIGRNLQDVTDFNNRYDNLNGPGESIFRLFLVSNNVISEEKPIYSWLHNDRHPEKKNIMLTTEIY